MERGDFRLESMTFEMRGSYSQVTLRGGFCYIDPHPLFFYFINHFVQPIYNKFIHTVENTLSKSKRSEQSVHLFCDINSDQKF